MVEGGFLLDGSRGFVRIVEDRITDVGVGDPPSSMRRGAGVVDATGAAVMPGMVNAHTHLFQTFLRGLADDKPLLDWLRDCIWPLARHFTAEEAEAAATLGIIENLRTGATTVIDHQYIHPDPEIDNAICSAAERLGVRFMLARGWADRNYDPALTETADTVIERLHDLEGLWHGAAGDRIRVESAPLIPWGCSDRAMKAISAASRGGIHIHCAETKAEVEMNLAERGVRHIEWLDNLGLLRPDTQLAHCVWLDDAELASIAASGAVVVHCPTSNMYLASGIARIVEMRELGIPIALATDGPGSNNRQDMFEAMKLSVLLQKVATGDAFALGPEDAIEMATLGGACAYGSTEIGRLEPGMKADMVVVGLDSPFANPVHRVQSALVFNATPGDVRTVIVDGKLLIDDGQMLMADERYEIARAKALCKRLFERAGVETGLEGG